MRSVQYAHWHQFFENLSISSKDFYDSLMVELQARKVPETKASEVEFLEGGLLSAKRLYLKIQRDWLTYHVCVAPFGTGFFVSTRLLVSPWKNWIVVVFFGAIMFGGIFLIFIGMTQVYNPAVAFLVAVFFTVPALIMMAIVIAIWIYLCLRLTWYRLDTMMAFQEAIHRLIVANVNKFIESHGRKPLTDEESKPILHKLLRG